jgi:hypothetical protein
LCNNESNICGRQTYQALIQIIPERKFNCRCAASGWNRNAGDRDVDFFG